MKRYVAIVLAMAAFEAVAFVGTGNDRIDEAREYRRAINKDSAVDYQQAAYFQGIVAGLSAVFLEPAYPYAICYPDGANLGQLADVASTYLIENPSERAESADTLIWRSHHKAFGFQSNPSCWRHDEWAKNNS